MNILLDYFFPITAIVPTPAASTAFLKQALLVVSPKALVTPGVIHECTSMAQVAQWTDNTEAQELFNAGMTRVYILTMESLDMAEVLNTDPLKGDFFTILISSDFDEDDVGATEASGTITITNYDNLVSGTADTIEVAGIVFTAQAGAVTPGDATFQAATSNNDTATSLAAQINEHINTKSKVEAIAVSGVITLTAKTTGTAPNLYTLEYTDNDANVGMTVSGATLSGGDGLSLGTFKGVVGVSSNDLEFLEDQAVIENRVAFYTSGSNGAKNMNYAFGKLLSNQLNWMNQQFIQMPYADDVTVLGTAISLFDDRISFVMSDSQYGNRLSLFSAGAKAIISPYIRRNLEIDLQSKALQYVSGNMPQYTKVQATLIEDELQKVIDEKYIARQWISEGTVQVKLEQDNFVASGYIKITDPSALWRIFGEVRDIV